jgi:hypothetical protein
MRLLILTLGILLSGLPLGAQDSLSIISTPQTEGAGAMIEQKLDRIDQRLGLMPDQRESIRKVLVDFTEKYGGQPPDTPEEKRQRRRALRQAVSTLLSPEQIALMKEGRKKRSGTLPDKRVGSPSPTPKRNFLDVILEDIATPLLERRKKNN